MTPGVLALVAVRMKSARLPGKAMRDLAGSTLIERLFERLGAAETPQSVVMCTSTNSQDDPLAEIARDRCWDLHRGHELDVMQRCLDAARARQAHTVIRVTGDNPLTDPRMLDHMVERHLDEGAEYSYTEDLPRGTPDRFRVLEVGAPHEFLRRPELRLTVDTPEDYAVVRSVYEAHDGHPPALGAIIDWLDAHPEIVGLNARVRPHEIDHTINVALQGDEPR